MNRSFRPFAWLLPLPLLVGCGSVLGYEDDYTLGGNAGASAVGGNAGVAGKAGGGGTSAGGKAGSATAGNAGNAGASTAGSAGASGGTAGTSSGNAGTTNGGNAGTTSGGNAGTTSGGNAGTNSGGKAGTSNGGNAGTAGSTTGGNAGTTSGGSAGTTGGGNAGTTSGGDAGASSAGAAGAPAGGSAGAPAGGNGGTAGAASGGNAGTTGGGGAGQGGTGVAGSGGAGGGGVVNPTDCSVIYVSPQGSLSNDGCSPGKPALNPLQGISSAKSFTKEIRICEGNYPGSITLSQNLSLKGSYDCATWTREPLSPEGPLTTISSNSTSAALFIGSSAITRESVIEGIYFLGSDGGKSSRAVTIQSGKPVLRLNRIEARSAKLTTTGTIPLSVGLSLDVDAGARVENNVILSGDGDTVTSAVASAGVVIDSLVGPIELVGNRITSGNALLHGKGYGTFGIYVEPLANQALTGPNAIRDNVIKSGLGRDENNAVEILSGGIFFDETSSARGTVEISGGVIVAGEASHAGTPGANVYPTAAGIFSGNHVSLTVDHARIYGGDATEIRGTSMAFNLGGTGTTTILSSALHGGGILADTPYPRALESRSSGVLTITASTLFSGVAHAVGGGQAGGTGIYLASPGRIVLRNNFFVMHSSFTVGIQLSGACSAPVASVLTGNAFGSTFASHSLFEGSGASPGCSFTAEDLPGLNGRFPTAANNIRISPSPKHTSELDLGCVPGPDCTAKLLTAFTSEENLRASVIAPTDASFSPKSCALSKPPAITSLTATDLLGNAVPQASPSVGALQVPAATCQ